MKIIPFLLFVLSFPASAVDRSHCGPDGFSPPAPPEMCEVHQVPEPGTLQLLVAALVAARVVRRKQ